MATKRGSRTGPLHSCYSAGSILGLGIGAIGIVARIAGLGKPHQQDDGTGQGDEDEEPVGAGLADVMEPPPGHRQARNQRCQRIEGRDAGERRGNEAAIARDGAQQAQYAGNDEVEQAEIPVLRPARTAAEVSVILKTSRHV